MNGDDTNAPDTPDPVTTGLDPDALKDAHGRTGRMLKSAGLPFEDDEFDDADDESSSTSSEEGEASSSSSSSTEEE
jgi:hypothetical protein